MKKFFRVLGGLAALSFLAAVMSCGGGVGPQSPSNDVITLETVKSMVTIKYANHDNANNVTQNVILSSSNISGISVAWVSSNPDIIKIEGTVGKVTRPKADTKVTLTATLKKGNETATKTFDLWVSGTVSDKLWSILSDAKPEKDAIFGSNPTLTLSNNVTWKSDHPEIIKIDESGTVTVTPPATKTAVVLTATATQKGVSESREFTVTVYPAGSTPTAQELLSSIDFTTTKINSRSLLPSEIKGVPGTQITWKSDKPQSISVEVDYGKILGVAYRSLRDVTVKLTATLTYNGQTASKTFDVTVERITEAEVPYSSDRYTFTDSEIIRTSPEGAYYTRGEKLAYTLDQEGRRITVHSTHYLSDDGRWIAIGSAEDKQLQKDYTEEGLTKDINKATALKTLSEKDPVTLRDCGRALGLDSLLTEEELYKELQNRDFIDPYQKYDDFKALSDDQKSTAIKEAIDSHKQRYINRFNLSSDADWTRILEAFNKQAQQARDNFEKEFQEWVNKSKTPHVYEYHFELNGKGWYIFKTIAVYDRTRRWFKQDGWYSNNSGLYEVAFFLEKILIGFRCEGQDYRGTLNSDGTEFKGKNFNGQEITCNITDNKDGTISVSIAGTSKTYTLNFRGDRLW